MELNRRNTFRNTINRVRDFSNNVADLEAATMVELKERLDLLKSSFDKLETEHLNLIEEAIDQATADAHNDYYDEVVRIKIDTVIKIQERIEHLENEARQNAAAAAAAAAVAAAAANQQNQANQGNINGNVNNNINLAAPAAAPEMPLERIKLTSFDGNHARWPEWISLFRGLVHTKHYTNTEKFHYMKGALIGSASDTVSGWNVTDDNYEAAYDALVALYDIPYRIIIALLDELFALDQLKTETYDGLRELINTVNRSTRQLAVAHCPVQHWDFILVHFLISRMPKTTLNQWENSRDLRDMPSLQDVISFLERRARAKVNSASDTNGSNGTLQSSTGAIPKQNKSFSNGKFSNGHGSKQSADSSGVNCSLCGNPHPTYRCAKLDRMDGKERRLKVSELKLCFVCLLPGHRAGSKLCKLGNCPICNKRHNRVLCDLLKSVNLSTVHTISDAPQYQQQFPSTSSANQTAMATSTSNSVPYRGAIGQVQANVWNQAVSNTQNKQNF